jgi:uncharacterized membrane protein YfcA
MLSGLVGIGGGIILVPAMYYIFHETQFQAQGTSLGVLTVPVTLVAFIQYYQECKKLGTPIDLKVIGLLAVGFVIGSYFGSNIAIRIDKELLKKIFAIVMFYTGIKMLEWDAAFIKWVKNIF